MHPIVANNADTGDINKEDFDAYERVRQSGKTNMFAVDVVEMLSGLDRKDIKYVMSNYERLVGLFYPDGVPEFEAE